MLTNIYYRFFAKPLYILQDNNIANIIDKSTSYCKKYYTKDKYQLNYNCSDDNNCQFVEFENNTMINLIIDIIKKNSSFFICKNLGGIIVDNVYYKNSNITLDKKYIFLMVIDLELFIKYISEFNNRNIEIINKYYDKYNFFINLYKYICKYLNYLKFFNLKK